MKSRYLIDTNIPMYAAGNESPWKMPSVQFLERVAAGEIEAVTDTEVLQEILHRYSHIGHRAHGFRVYDLFRQVVDEVLPVEVQDMDKARDLFEEYPALTSRDAIHAALAYRHGLAILSYDRHFDGLDHLTRLEP